MVEKEPIIDIDKEYGVLPSEFHKMKMTLIPTNDCKKLYFRYCIACPKHRLFIYHAECEKCEHGVKGNYREEWILCNFQSIEEV